eukprot:TRINITY_DN3312_c0_g1_i3.p1 TRINITY_DN3312_c0_g1~~TRINITY_DN3312_c0_g1_i3.p1  ORF type:complete len:103 (-),score=15.90 TRINITY_DN3312_c0_g1_i3:54-362(-)
MSETGLKANGLCRRCFNTILRSGDFRSGPRKERSCGSFHFQQSYGTYGRRETQGVLKEKKTTEEILCDKIKFSVAQWVQINPIFTDYPTDRIMFDWKELAFS